MKKSVFAATLLAALCVFTAFNFSANASSASANLTVSVDVDTACAINTSAVSFPVYEPIGANYANPDDSTAGSVVIVCTAGVVANIGLGAGSNVSGLQSRMLNSSSSTYLPYALFQDSTHTTPWGNGPGTWMTVPAAPDSSARTYVVYGRIPSGQSGAGHYADTVVATVNF